MMSREQQQAERFAKTYDMQDDPTAMRTLPDMFQIYNAHNNCNGNLFSKLQRTAMQTGRLTVLEATVVAEAFVDLLHGEEY